MHVLDVEKIQEFILNIKSIGVYMENTDKKIKDIIEAIETVLELEKHNLSNSSKKILKDQIRLLSSE